MKHKVLLVEDESSVIRSLREPLASDLWEVVPTKKARHALEWAQTGETGLVVIAIDLRTAAEWAVIDAITEANPILPVVVITHPELTDLAKAVGARAVVEQPLDVPGLLRTMRDLLIEEMTNQLCGTTVRQGGLQHVPANNEAFLDSLRQRYTTPFHFGGAFRHWGIND